MAGILSVLGLGIPTYPILKSICGFLQSYAAITTCLVVLKVITASILLSAVDGAIEINVKVSPDFAGIGRTLIEEQILGLTAKYPLLVQHGITFEKSQNGNVYCWVKGIVFMSVECNTGSIVLQANIDNGAE